MESKLAFDVKTFQLILKKVGTIDSFKGKWGSIEGKESIYLNELKRIATIESIGSSTRIEGATLSNEEVDTLLNSIKVTEFKTRDEQEVFGYYETLSLILDSFDGIEIKESHIHHLHKTLLIKSSKDIHHRGQYKQLSNKVVANYPDGTQRIIFNTTEPFRTKEEMDILIKWVNEQFEEELIHPLIIIATFVYEFLSIHPYQDGNGRLSRLLTTLLLLQQGYDFMQFTSMELEIEKNKKQYYNALMAGQKNRNTENEKINEWILFFLDTLIKSALKLEEQFEQIKNQKSYLNSRQKEVLEFIKNNEPVKSSDVANQLSNYTSYTLKKDLSYLFKENLIKRIGKARATIYLFNKKK